MSNLYSVLNDKNDPDHLILGNEDLMNYILFSGFIDAPASTKYHGAYPGGLLDHSVNVTSQLIDMTSKFGLVWRRKESPLIVGLFHDLCKVDQYAEKKAGPDSLGFEYEGAPVYEHVENTLLKGHGEKSVMILSQFMRLTEEEVLCIRYHMGAYNKEDWECFDLAIRKYPNVLWTHTADMVASKLMEE